MREILLDEIRRELLELDARAAAAFELSTELLDSVAHANRLAKRARRVPWSIQLASANRKLNPIRVEIAKSGRRRFVATGPFVASTYVSIASTCPDTCTFKNNGCYAQAGQSHLVMGELDRSGRSYAPLEVSRGEALALGALWPKGVPQDGARGGRDLRLHVGGDVSCRRGARALGDAVALLKARGLGTAWTYTHRWREIPRASWGPISVLASVETVEDAAVARDLGYAPAITVDRFRGRKAFALGDGIKAIPCPFEAGGSGPTCNTCRLCLDRDLPRLGAAIAFAVHGAKADDARRRLPVLQG
jgi:hypothetical protein